MMARSGGPRRLSLVRLLVAFAITAAVIGSGSWWARDEITRSQSEASNTWFAPYVDATLTPYLQFEDRLVQPSDNVVLGFVVSDPHDGCEPSWGTYYNLDAAARALDLDRKIVSLRERGGDALVSFGGAVNQELASSCQDPAALQAAYQSVIDRYGLTSLDFDVEGAALSDTAANGRRAAAIHGLQQANKNLSVWFTLPVDPQGLGAASVAMIDQTLQAGVDLRGVNAMIMDYGGSKPTDVSERDAARQALTGTWQQLTLAYQRAGRPHSEVDVWNMIGATPMIGQNDEKNEVFSTDDASWLASFARQNHLGRLSFWSANRDVECGAGEDDKRVSNTCSGVEQDPLQFTRTFMSVGKNTSVITAQASTHALTSGDATPDLRAEGLSHDDPRTSPYPIWRGTKAYEASAKVVWQDRVYQAKWYTQNNQPDAPVSHPWDTPWRYLGPVLDADRQAIKAVLVAATGVPPSWESERVYIAGDEVEYFGKAYRAKWWTQGQMPQQDPDQPYDYPWEYVGDVIKPTPTPLLTASGTPGPTVSATPQSTVVYTVKANDNLSNIASQFGVSVFDLVNSNHIVNPQHLEIGQQLVVINPKR